MSDAVMRTDGDRFNPRQIPPSRLGAERRDLTLHPADFELAAEPGRIVVVDFEGTGNQVPKDAEIRPGAPGLLIEIGAVELLLDGEGWRRGGTFHTYLNPRARLNPYAVKVHGIRSSMLADKPTFDEVWPGFRDFLGNATIAAHAYNNERHALIYETRRIGAVAVDAEPYPLERWFCTQVAFKRAFPNARSKLDAVCDRFGIDRGQRRLHGALLDADLTASAFVALAELVARPESIAAPR